MNNFPVNSLQNSENDRETGSQRTASTTKSTPLHEITATRYIVAEPFLHPIAHGLGTLPASRLRQVET